MKHIGLRALAATLGAVLLALAALVYIMYPTTEIKPAISRGGRGDGKLRIVTTLFPVYDFARDITGGRAHVSMLIPPGVEAHMFDPRPSDIKSIYDADVFIYTGDAMEPWVKKVIAGINDGSPIVVDASVGVSLKKSLDGHGKDPHFWLDPTLAELSVYDIVRALRTVDPDNGSFYSANAVKLASEFEKLDRDTAALVKHARRRTLVFGGHFACRYFLDRYKLKYVTVFNSTSSESEPSTQSVADAISFVRKNKIPCVYYGELENRSVAEAVASACDVPAELFDTAHNVTLRDFERGTTFIQIMRGNLTRLRRGLY